MTWGGGGGGVDRRVGVWRKVTGNAIGICASRSSGRTTICWGTGDLSLRIELRVWTLLA